MREVSSTQRRAIAQSSLVAKATRQENSSKSFRVLMDIGPHLCSSVNNRSPIPWPKSDGGLAEFRRSLRSVGLRPRTAQATRQLAEYSAAYGCGVRLLCLRELRLERLAFGFLRMLGFSLTSRSFIRSTIATSADFDAIKTSALFAEAPASQARGETHESPPYWLVRVAVAAAASALAPPLALPQALSLRKRYSCN